MDGNQKNNRPECAAEEAGFVEYKGLPGSVKTECMETPLQQSRFCTYHRPRVVHSKDQPDPDKVVETLLTKKKTRNSTFYEVHTYLEQPNQIGYLCSFTLNAQLLRSD